MNICKIILPACILSVGLPNLFAVSESEAINKTPSLNTGGHRGALPEKQPKNASRYQYDDSRTKNYSQSLAEWSQSTERRPRSTHVAERNAYASKNNSSQASRTKSYARQKRASSRTNSVAQASRTKSYARQKSVSEFSPEPSPVSIEFFYALATNSLVTYCEEVSLVGIAGEYIFKTYGDGSENTPKIEFLVSAGLGIGSGEDKFYDETWSNGDWVSTSDYTKYEYSVLHGQVAVGSNIRWQVGDGWDFYVGARLGLSYLRAEGEETYVESSYYYGTVSESYEADDSALGLFYGVRAGTDVCLTEDQKLTFAVDLWGSTTRPTIADVELNAQAYIVFSAGYKFTF